MKVVQLQRHPAAGRFSIEGYFSRVREFLSASDVDIELAVLPNISRGLSKRIGNVLAARRTTGDIYHVTGDVNYVAIGIPRRQTVVTVLDCEVLHRNTGIKRAVLKLFWFTIPVRWAAAVTVISEETKRQLLNEVKIPEDRIRVIPVSVSDQFEPSGKAFNTKCPRILQIGTKDNKNLVRLADALQGIACHLDIVGPLSPQIKTALAKNGIRFSNYLQLTDAEIVQRYVEADIVSFVSTHEGFGMPIVEAQCVERICVTSNCSSMPEVAGDGACLVDPFDVHSIRNGFKKVIDDSNYRNAVIAAGRLNKLRFSPQKIADDFLALYQQLHQESID